MTTKHVSSSSVLRCVVALVAILRTVSLEPIAKHETYMAGQSGKLLHDVMIALQKASDFFKADYSSVNVDGLFGIRLAQGNILEASHFCAQPTNSCPSEVTERLLLLNSTIGELGEKALPYVREQDEEYFSRFSPTIDGPYILPYRAESIGPYLAAPGHFDDYGEEEGDKCFASLMGTWQTGQHPQPVARCTVSDGCWELMTRPNQSKYSITHQLLFFIVGEKTGCLDQLNTIARERHLLSVKELEKAFCGHIVGEMKEETREGDVSQLYQDLFLEQTVLCGTLGYHEVFPTKWINMVLGWQNARGCFSMPSSMIKLEAQVQKVSMESKHLLALLQAEAEAIEGPQRPGRKLLREKVMEDECLSHKSGLGFGVIGAYLRYLVQTRYS